MGDNFKNYLNIYRLEKAKEFMEYNKDLKIKELAELVGYNSSNTFIRIFRKYEGVSPGKYFGIGEHEEQKKENFLVIEKVFFMFYFDKVKQ